MAFYSKQLSFYQKRLLFQKTKLKERANISKLYYMVLDIWRLTAWKRFIFVVFLVHIFPYLDQNNSKYGHFLCDEKQLVLVLFR